MYYLVKSLAAKISYLSNIKGLFDLGKVKNLIKLLK